jgi:hypothetical protein
MIKRIALAALAIIALLSAPQIASAAKKHTPKRLFTFRHAEARPVSSLLAADVFFGS